MSPDYIFTLVYFLLTICLIYPPTEFSSAGLTIPSIFSNVLGSEHDKFITYHMNKSCLYLFIYSVLPLGYIVLSSILEYTVELSELFTSYSLFWRLFATSSIVFPCLSLYQILEWTRNNFEKHPIAVTLQKFCNNNTNWQTVAEHINIEFRRIDKTSIQTSAIVRIIATENWILKITPLTMFIIHQSDASLVVKEANTYELSPLNTSTQYLNIEVKSGRRGIDPFIIRINANDFKDLKDRVARIITIMPNVKFHQSVIDQFVEVFKDTIKSNPEYEYNQELDQCIGCLQASPSIKIQKLCEDSTSQPTNCTNCYCKPMWCTDCMAKWFASRQDAEQQNKWLSSKCTCPMCRATFCMLDICLLKEVDHEE